MSLLRAVVVAATWMAAAGDSERDDIREATFRYMFTHNASGQKPDAGVYCLEIEDADPSDAFMARFAGSMPPVKKASQCTASGEDGVRDKKTKKPGLILRVEAVRLDGDS